MATLGKLHNISKTEDTKESYEWKVEKFFSLPRKLDKSYKSASFSFAGTSWHLSILPYGSKTDNSVGYVGVYLYKEETDTPFTLSCSFSLETSSGVKSHEVHSTYVFQKNQNALGFPKFVKRSTLSEKRPELVPSEALTIIFTLESHSSTIDEASSFWEPELKTGLCEEDSFAYLAICDMKTVGNVQDVTKDAKQSFEWEIKNFFSHLKVRNFYKSPLFSFAGATWCFVAFPFGHWEDASLLYVGVHIYNGERDIPLTFSYSFSSKTSNGKKSHEKSTTQMFQESEYRGFPRLVKLSTLSQNISELVPSETLTIIFTAESYSTTVDEASSLFACKLNIGQFEQYPLEYTPVPDMETLGKVHDVTKDTKKTFEWEIKNFFSLPRQVGKSYKSPLISFAGASWYLIILPCGSKIDGSFGYIGVYIYKEETDTVFTLTYSFSLKTSSGEKSHEVPTTHTFHAAENAYGCPTFVAVSTLSKKKSELVPSETLTIIFTAEAKCTDETDQFATASNSCYRSSFDVEDDSSDAQTYSEKKITCHLCKRAFTLTDMEQHACVSVVVKDNDLVRDFANILESGEHSDFTVKVRDTEFRLHKCIFAGRNDYSLEMFEAEMAKNKTSTVTIEDCEPYIFRFFLHFIYTGELRLAHDSVCALYEVAHKHLQSWMKAECLRFIKDNMSTESFCDFFLFVMKYGGRELLHFAKDFFSKKKNEIIQTVKWQNFMREQEYLASELLRWH